MAAKGVGCRDIRSGGGRERRACAGQHFSDGTAGACCVCGLPRWKKEFGEKRLSGLFRQGPGERTGQKAGYRLAGDAHHFMQCVVCKKQVRSGKKRLYCKERYVDGGTGGQRDGGAFVGEISAPDERTGAGKDLAQGAGFGGGMGNAGLGDASCCQSVNVTNFLQKKD